MKTRWNSLCDNAGKLLTLTRVSTWWFSSRGSGPQSCFFVWLFWCFKHCCIHFQHLVSIDFCIKAWLPWVAQLVKNLRAMQETRFDPGAGTIPWRRKWQPTPVFLCGESHGQRSLAGYSPKGCTESDTTKVIKHLFF